MTTNLVGNTKIKVSQLYIQSFARLQDKKSQFFIGHRNGIHVNDITNNKIQEIKLDKNQYPGPFSCFTISDQLVFFCCGSKVLAMGQNLKIIFELDTFLAIDKIDNIFIHGYRMFLVSQNMLNEFLIGGIQLMNKKSRITQSPTQKSQDIQQQVFDSKINHSLMINITAQKPFLLLLKSNNQIQTFQKKQPQATFKTDSPPTYAYLYPKDGQNQNKVLIGTANGQILYLQVNRKSIKKLWSITQSKGKVNTICQIKNGFFITKDKTVEFWNKNRQLIKEEKLDEKVVSTMYLQKEETLVYGTVNGTVVEIKNYQKMLKENKKMIQVKQRQQILKQIQLLRHKKSLLQQKLAQKKGQSATSNISTLKKINIKSSITIDYVSLCYNIQLQSDTKICKIILQGPIQLLQQKQNIFFTGKTNKDKQNVYILRYENEANIQIKVKYPETFNQLQKMTMLVYFSFQARVHNIMMDLKQLALHQKVSVKGFQKKNAYLNRLQMKGNFKLQMKRWLMSIFNDFSAQKQQQYEVACYQSIITKQKIFIKFKPSHCIILSQSSNPLLIIKKKIFSKSRQTNISISFDTFTSKQSIHNFLQSISGRIRQINQTRHKYQLLPGLLQLKNQLNLQKNQQLLQILDQRDNIMMKYQQNKRLQVEIKEKIVDLYKSYKMLNNREINQYEEKNVINAIDKWDTKGIESIICS